MKRKAIFSENKRDVGGTRRGGLVMGHGLETVTLEVKGSQKRSFSFKGNEVVGHTGKRADICWCFVSVRPGVGHFGNHFFIQHPG